MMKHIWVNMRWTYANLKIWVQCKVQCQSIRRTNNLPCYCSIQLPHFPFAFSSSSIFFFYGTSMFTHRNFPLTTHTNTKKSNGTRPLHFRGHKLNFAVNFLEMFMSETMVWNRCFEQLFLDTYIGETSSNLNTQITEHKGAPKNVDLNNHIAEHHSKTKHYWLGLCWVLNLLYVLLTRMLKH